MEVNVTLFVCIFNRFSEMYIVFERGPRLAIITSSDQRLPPKKINSSNTKDKNGKKRNLTDHTHFNTNRIKSHVMYSYTYSSKFV